MVGVLASVLGGAAWASAQTATVPPSQHVFIVIGENAGYAQTYRTGAMPYLDSLAAKYGLAVNYISDTHGSDFNYFVLSSGQELTFNPTPDPATTQFTVDNIALDLQNAGKTWKEYVENINSSCGGLIGSTFDPYHDPFIYYTNVNQANRVCFSQFAADLSSHTLPNLSWLSPNTCGDAHDTCNGQTLANMDTWLKTEIAPLLASSYFQPGGDGLLVITFDEDQDTGGTFCSTSQIESGTWCGGQVETVVISPLAKPGYQSSNAYHDENILRLFEEALGLTEFPGASADANKVLSPPIDMADFFAASSAVVSLSPTSWSAGNVAVGKSVSQAFTLKNGTSSALSISSIGLSPATSGFSKTTTCGASLAAGTSCDITVTFAPLATGSVSATLAVTDSAGSESASLSGTGVNATASLSPTSLAFGNVTTGTTSAIQYSTLSNNGSTTLTISSLVISGPPFAFSGLGTCGASLAPGGTCTISVKFSPTATGTFTGKVTVNDSATNSPQTLGLSGTGTSSTPSGPVASFSPNPLNFGSVSVGNTSSVAYLTLTNKGGSALSITGSYTITGANAADFAFAGVGSCPGVGGTVAAGASCLISLKFTPKASGTRTAQVNVSDNASGSPQSVALTGTGSSTSGPVVSLSPSSVNFGTLSVGSTSSVVYVTLKNIGASALTLTSSFTITGTDAADFAFAGLGNCPGVGGTIGAGSSCLISLKFTPKATGTRTAHVNLFDNAANSPQAIPLSGTAN